jgi:hypothetical protein
LLLKTSTVGEDESGAMGVVMLWLLACVFASALCTVVLESFSARKWIHTVTHAFNILYEGKILETEGVPCIASFPGKFEAEWKKVVDYSNNGHEELSVACVFLPQVRNIESERLQRKQQFKLLV